MASPTSCCSSPIFRDGKLVYTPPPLEETPAAHPAATGALHPAIKRLVNPHEYPAGLEAQLHALRTRLILEARGVG